MTAVAPVYPIVTGCNRDALRTLLGEGNRRVLTGTCHDVAGSALGRERLALPGADVTFKWAVNDYPQEA